MFGFTEEQIKRYSRQIILPQVGGKGQHKLLDSRVLLVGAGGLGSPAGLYLAAAGVGTLGFVDFDVVDISNLHRQVLHAQADIGRLKTESAAETLQALNPDVQVVQHPTRLTAANAQEIISRYDVIVDGSDNFPAKYLVNDTCVWLHKPLVFGAVFQFYGQAAVFKAGAGPCYRCMFPNPPPPGSVPNCQEGGVLGAVPGVIGTIQAIEVLKLLLGVGDTLIGKFLLFDALAMDFMKLEVKPSAECPVCGEHPTITEPLDYELACGLSGQ